MTASRFEIVADWCANPRHILATMGRPEQDADYEDTYHFGDEPQPCVVIFGAPLCIACLQLAVQELTPTFVAWMRGKWQRIDAGLAVETAAELTKPRAT